MHVNQNPATYMLEVLGNSTIDFHSYYNNSSLCEANLIHAQNLSKHTTNNSNENNQPTEEWKFSLTRKSKTTSTSNSVYLTSYFHQFRWVSYKVGMSYWRTPSYNFGRIVIAILVAFVFSSAYPSQTYYEYSGVISRIGLIYITTLALGAINLQTILPVTADELVSYYREQQSTMYSPLIYTICNLIVEIPYVIISSLCFVLPFFYFVGFQNVGIVAAKFGYYWLFIGLYEMTLINLGQLVVASTSSLNTAGIVTGVCSNLFSMFAGFMINPADIPSFWQFLYWLDPLHYAFQGIVFTQFHGDTTLVSYI